MTTTLESRPTLQAATRTQRRTAVAVALVALMALGLGLRLRNLGALGLIGDEGYQALAVRAILEQGVPRLDTGAVYFRAPLFLYSEALSARLFGLSEFSLRLPAVLFGVLCTPAGYALSRQLLGGKAALLVAAMIAVSAWNIELSRYARFYTLFQGLYTIALFFFYRGFILDRPWDRVWFFTAAFLTLSVHELGVMLATCFLIILPLRGYTPGRRLLYLFLPMSVVALWVASRQIIAAISRAVESPESATNAAASIGVGGTAGAAHATLAKVAHAFPLDPIDLRFVTAMAERHPLTLAILALPLLMLAAFLIHRAWRHREPLRAALLLLIIAAAAVHQAILAGCLAVLYLACYVRDRRHLLEPCAAATWIGAGLATAFWLAYFAVNPGIPFRYGVRKMLAFPDLYDYFLQWFVPGWPVMSVLLVIGVVILARRATSSDRCSGAWFVLGALALPMVATSAVHWMHSEARYFFHLYPLILTATAAAMLSITRWIIDATRLSGLRAAMVGAAVLVLAFVSSADVSVLSAWRIGDRSYTTPKDPIRGVVNWRYYAHFHPDQRSPALFVAAHLQPGDRVVSVGPPHKGAIGAFYAGRVDFQVGDPDHYMSSRLGEDGRLYDRMTGGEVVHDVQRLREITGEYGGRLWLLSDTIITEPDTLFLDPALKTELAQYATPRHPGADGISFASRIPLVRQTDGADRP